MTMTTSKPRHHRLLLMVEKLNGVGVQRRDLVGHVRHVAPLFQKRLKALADHPLVGEAVGLGLIVAPLFGGPA